MVVRMAIKRFLRLSLTIANMATKTKCQLRLPHLTFNLESLKVAVTNNCDNLKQSIGNETPLFDHLRRAETQVGIYEIAKKQILQMNNNPNK